MQCPGPAGSRGRVQSVQVRPCGSSDDIMRKHKDSFGEDLLHVQVCSEVVEIENHVRSLEFDGDMQRALGVRDYSSRHD